jgi:hypothetical protein
MQTYMSYLYYNHNNQFDKICVGLVFFDGKVTIIDIKKEKMSFVKKLNKKGYDLFKHSVESFKNHYLDNGVSYEIMDRAYRYNNNMFQISKPSMIGLECNKENFYRFFEKYV